MMSPFSDFIETAEKARTQPISDFYSDRAHGGCAHHERIQLQCTLVGPGVTALKITPKEVEDYPNSDISLVRDLDISTMPHLPPNFPNKDRWLNQNICDLRNKLHYVQSFTIDGFRPYKQLYPGLIVTKGNVYNYNYYLVIF